MTRTTASETPAKLMSFWGPLRLLRIVAALSAVLALALLHLAQAGSLIGPMGRVAPGANVVAEVAFDFGSPEVSLHPNLQALTAGRDGFLYGVSLRKDLSEEVVFRYSLATGYEEFFIPTSAPAPQISSIFNIIQANDGNLYLTGSRGGASGLGGLLRVDPARQSKLVHSFDGSAYAAGNLTQDNGGNIYGWAAYYVNAPYYPWCGALFRYQTASEAFEIISDETFTACEAVDVTYSPADKRLYWISQSTVSLPWCPFTLSDRLSVYNPKTGKQSAVSASCGTPYLWGWNHLGVDSEARLFTNSARGGPLDFGGLSRNPQGKLGTTLAYWPSAAFASNIIQHVSGNMLTARALVAPNQLSVDAALYAIIGGSQVKPVYTSQRWQMSKLENAEDGGIYAYSRDWAVPSGQPTRFVMLHLYSR